MIEDVDRKIPPTADLPGLFLLLKNAATQRVGRAFSRSRRRLPTPDPTTGLSSITVAVTAQGSYFAVTEFLFNIETLPRAAKVQTSLAPGASDTTDSSRTVTDAAPQRRSMVLYTQDPSAGPGSNPGPGPDDRHAPRSGRDRSG